MYKYLDNELDYLMVRGFLHESDKLNILILMEKLDKEKSYNNEYTYILNNPHWQPSLEFFKERSKKNKNDDELTQEINQEKKTYQIFSIYKKYPGWRIVNDQFLYTQEDGDIIKKQYNLKVKKNKKTRRLVVQPNGEIIRGFE